MVDNASRRRILDAACRIEPSEGAGLTLAAERVGLLADNLLADARSDRTRAMMNNAADGSTVPLIRAGASDMGSSSGSTSRRTPMPVSRSGSPTMRACTGKSTRTSISSS